MSAKINTVKDIRSMCLNNTKGHKLKPQMRLQSIGAFMKLFFSQIHSNPFYSFKRCSLKAWVLISRYLDQKKTTDGG